MLLVAVLPGIGVNSSMPDMDSSLKSVSNGMVCPDCPANSMKAGSSSCAQASCVGFAVITETASFFGSYPQAYFQLATVRPDEIALALPTPPI